MPKRYYSFPPPQVLYAASASYALLADETQGTASYAITASYALNGGGGGVTQIVAGTNITISPPGGTGVVTINASSTTTSASYAQSASVAVSASYATSASYAVSASYARSSSIAVSSSYAISASYAVSSSYSLSGSYAVSASYAKSSSYAFLSSLAVTASYLSGIIEASSFYLGTSGYFISYQGNASPGGTTPIANVATGSFRGAFFDYTADDGTTNARAGTIQIIIFNNTVQYNETTTMDIGDTSDLTWSVVIVGPDAVIQATTSLYSWNIRYILRNV